MIMIGMPGSECCAQNTAEEEYDGEKTDDCTVGRVL